MLKANNNKIVLDKSSKIDETVKNLFKKPKNKKSKNLIYIRVGNKFNFLNFDTKKILNCL